jgi:hypothetical protein
MAKRQLKFMPLLGQYMTFSNAVFVDRAKRDDAIKVFEKVAEEMKEKSVRSLSFLSLPSCSLPSAHLPLFPSLSKRY